MKQLICSVNESSNKSESWTQSKYVLKSQYYWNETFFRRKHAITLYKKYFFIVQIHILKKKKRQVFPLLLKRNIGPHGRQRGFPDSLQWNHGWSFQDSQITSKEILPHSQRGTHYSGWSVILAWSLFSAEVLIMFTLL